MIRSFAWGALMLSGACAPRPQGAPAPLPAAPAFTAPLTVDSLHIPFVRGSLNGTEAGWWVVDSGAAPCVVDKGRAEDLGLDVRGRTQVRGAGAGPVAADSVRSRTVIQVEDVETFECEHLLALDLAGLTSLGRRVEGILGFDFFRRWVVEFDYAGGRMRLYEPQGFRYQGTGRRIPLQFRGRRPYITVRMDPGDGGGAVERTLLVDTGSGDAVDDSVVLRSPAAKSRAEGGVGLGARYPVVLGRVSSVELGGYVLRDVPGVAPGVALIGGNALRRFRVILDYGRQEMILEPGPAFGEPFAGSAPPPAPREPKP
ncbi:MAG TPA: retropepsin-like aspartic protease [Longimicrobium sp.]|jgi:hypothetical protein|uniref:retropepsin-like aspartic protease n=1 Tax=Longimicrobium sp. TaxID=2029185 RepID=UPI002ED79234